MDYQHKTVDWATWVKVASNQPLPAWIPFVLNRCSFLNFHKYIIAQKNAFGKIKLFTMYVYVRSRAAPRPRAVVMEINVLYNDDHFEAEVFGDDVNRYANCRAD